MLPQNSLNRCYQKPFPLVSFAGQPIFDSQDALRTVLNTLTRHLRDSHMRLHELLHEIRTLQQAIETKLQQQRHEIEKKRYYLHYVMHDVKNALSGIVSCTELMQGKNLTPQEHAEFAGILASEIERVIGMTQDLVDFAYGRQQMVHVQPCQINDFLADVVPIIEHILAGRPITLSLNVQYTGQINIDAEKMKSVILNIAYNACDAMPDGGHLTITVRAVDAMIHWEFVDTGCGMPPELQAHFLEPFVTAGKPHGTGLGMAIVKEIVDAHHGHIDVESELGKGTMIRIILPSHLPADQDRDLNFAQDLIYGAAKH